MCSSRTPIPVAYPVTLLLSLSPPVQLRLDRDRHLLLGAVSLYGLCRTLRPLARATVASFIYPLVPRDLRFLLINPSGPGTGSRSSSCSSRATRGGGARWLLPLSLVLGLQMFTYIQSTYVRCFAAPFALCLLRPRRGNGGVAACAVRILGLAAALVLGTLAASALLLPLRELSGQVSYKPFTFEEAAIFPLPKEIALESLLSGRPWDSFFAANWSSTFYMGAGGIALALYSLVAVPRRRLALLLAAVCALALLLALGDRTPLFYLFHRWMPGATRFHAPVRFLWLLPLPISLMAGMGLDGLGARKGRRGRECFFFAALFLCAALLWLGREAAVRPFALVPLSLSGLRLLVVASLAAATIAVGRALGFVGKGLTAALLAGLSVTEACGCFSYISFVDFKEKYAVPATARFLRERAGLARFFSYNGARRNYATAFPDDDAVSMLYPELSNYFGLYDIQARGPLRVERYDGLIKAMNRRHEMFRERGSYQAEVRNFLSPVVDLFGVRFIVSKGALRVPCEVIYQDPHEIHLRAGESATLPAGRTVSAGAIVLESFLEGAAGAAQGEAVAEIVLQAGGREVAVVPVRAGVQHGRGVPGALRGPQDSRRTQPTRRARQMGGKGLGRERRGGGALQGRLESARGAAVRRGHGEVSLRGRAPRRDGRALPSGGPRGDRGTNPAPVHPRLQGPCARDHHLREPGRAPPRLPRGIRDCRRGPAARPRPAPRRRRRPFPHRHPRRGSAPLRARAHGAGIGRGGGRDHGLFPRPGRAECPRAGRPDSFPERYSLRRVGGDRRREGGKALPGGLRIQGGLRPCRRASRW